MKKNLLLLLALFGFSAMHAQVYLDQFDDGEQYSENVVSPGYMSSEADGEWTITGNGTAGPWDVLTYIPYDAATNTPDTLDITGNNKIFVRAKASTLGTQLRMDVEDVDGFVTTQQSISATLVNEYTIFEFDFTDKFIDGGFGGTACAAGPCPVDGSRIEQFVFFINPGQGGFGGNVKIDFISVGSEPSVGPMSDVWQEHFDGDSLSNYSGLTPGWSEEFSDSAWKITGDGTNAMWDPISFNIYNQSTFETTDIDVTGNDKVFIRMKANVPNTAIRLDLQDINDFVTTAGSVTKVITEADSFVTYEFNFAGAYQDLAFGGTGCVEGPCEVDGERIYNMIIFINPGVEAFAGEVEFDYISVGTALEDNPGGDLVLAYGDHFSGGEIKTATDNAFVLEEKESNLVITGDGSDPPFAAISYSVHDMTSNENIILDVTGNNKMFFKAKASVANTLLRIDLVDTAGYVTTLPSFTRILGTDYSSFEIDFGGQYLDGGYGGTSCEMDPPCPVDGKAISTVLLYPNPADGGFTGTIEIDYLSFGAPLDEDVPSYSDHFDDEDGSFLSAPDGFSSAESGTEVVLTGDGSAGAYAAFGYTLHTAGGEGTSADVTPNDKIYIKAKASVEGAPFRIDVQDGDGFVSNNPSVARNLTTDYAIYEFDFGGQYVDGGFGGTPCATGPCPVDASNITSFLMYVDPDNGGYDGTVTIDWISTLEPLETIVDGGPKGVDDYTDEFSDNSVEFFGDPDGLTSSIVDGTLTITGNGGGGPWTPVNYTLHDIDGGSGALMVNVVTNNDKLYMRAKSSEAALPIRIDLQDNIGYVTSNPSVERNIETDWSIVEFDYAGTYTDGGFGGTPCAIGPCPVDGERIASLVLFVKPGVGAFDGTLDVDWVTFGEPLSVGIENQDVVKEATLFPNPTTSDVYIDMELLQAGDMRVNVYDMMGRLIRTQERSVNNGKIQEEISLNGVDAGFYNIQVLMDGRQVLTHKIVKR